MNQIKFKNSANTLNNLKRIGKVPFCENEWIMYLVCYNRIVLHITIQTVSVSLCAGWQGFPRSHRAAWSSRVPRTWGAHRIQRREGVFGIRSSTHLGRLEGLNVDVRLFSRQSQGHMLRPRNNPIVILRIVLSENMSTCVPNHYLYCKCVARKSLHSEAYIGVHCVSAWSPLTCCSPLRVAMDLRDCLAPKE